MFEFFHNLTSWAGLSIGCLIIILSVIYVYLTWHYGVLEKMGIPVKKPYFCFGSVPLQYYRLQYYDDIENMKKYGKIWGVYEGRTPELYVADPDLVKQMFVKDFDYFSSSRIFDFKNPMISEFILQLGGEKWKTVRSSLSPMFSARKMRSWSNTVKNNAEHLVQHVRDLMEDKQHIVLSVKSLYDSLAIDVIGESFFGSKMSSLGDTNNQFVLYCIRFLQRFQVPKWLLLLSSLFPSMLPSLDVFDAESLEFFRNVTQNLIEERKLTGKTYDDFVDTLIEMEKKFGMSDKKHLKFIKESIYTLGFTMFIAGFNSTSTTLTMVTYLLAKHPEVQEKAYKEVQNVIKKHGELNRETVGKLKYISAIVDETLRLFPLVVRLERECQRDWEYQGLKVPKGVVVKVPAFGMHHCPDYFPDPEDFKPERFLKSDEGQDYHPYSYLPFAAGPRNCIGMRFALEEQQLVVGNMVNSFKFVLVKESKLEFVPGLVFLAELLAIQDLILEVQLR